MKGDKKKRAGEDGGGWGYVIVFKHLRKRLKSAMDLPALSLSCSSSSAPLLLLPQFPFLWHKCSLSRSIT